MSDKVSDLQTRLHYALGLRGKRAVDLVNDLKIPKSAVSQYLSGKSQKMDSGRLFEVCRYLGVSEPWLLGYDVPMEEHEKKPANDDGLTDAQRALMDFVLSVPADKAAKVLRAMQIILEDD
jgi:transcriptional regulator with XRE-family HTH domain